MRIFMILSLLFLCMASCTNQPSWPPQDVKAVHGAVNEADVSMINSLLKGNPSLVGAPEELHGDTPLHVAAYEGNREIVNLLISYNADVNAPNNIGATPLHWAALTNRKDIAQALIDAGAQVNAPTLQGKTPLRIAMEYQSRDAEEVLKKHGAKEDVPQAPGKK